MLLFHCRCRLSMLLSLHLLLHRHRRSCLSMLSALLLHRHRRSCLSMLSALLLHRHRLRPRALLHLLKVVVFTAAMSSDTIRTSGLFPIGWLKGRSSGRWRG
jgi:hypothetical protein